MHRCNVSIPHISIHTRLRIYSSAFANFLIQIYRLTVIECVPRKERQNAITFRVLGLRIEILIQRNTGSIEYSELIISTKLSSVLLILFRTDRFRQISIIEDALRLTVVTKYNLGRQGICRVINRYISNPVQQFDQVNLNLTSYKVRFTSIKDRFRCNNIVIAIFSDLGPKFLINRLVPRQTEFLVVNAKLNLPLL